MESQKVVNSKQTAFEEIYDRLIDENSRLASLVERFVGLGHKLQDTREPDAKEKGTEPTDVGAISSFNRQLGYYNSQNNQLEKIYQKFADLL